MQVSVKISLGVKKLLPTKKFQKILKLREFVEASRIVNTICSDSFSSNPRWTVAVLEYNVHLFCTAAAAGNDYKRGTDRCEVGEPRVTNLL